MMAEFRYFGCSMDRSTLMPIVRLSHIVQGFILRSQLAARRVPCGASSLAHCR